MDGSVNPPENPPEDLHRLLGRAGRAVARWDRRAAAGHGLGPTAAAVLAQLVATGPLAHRELAGALGLAPATLTPVIDGLERAGDVSRRRDGADRRVVRVIATEAGRRRIEQVGPAIIGLTARYLPSPPEPQRAVVRRWLVDVVAALEGAGPVPPSPLPSPPPSPLSSLSSLLSSQPDGGPAPGPAGEVEPCGEGPWPAVELDDHRHLGDPCAGMAQPQRPEPHGAPAGAAGGHRPPAAQYRAVGVRGQVGLRAPAVEHLTGDPQDVSDGLHGPRMGR